MSATYWPFRRYSRSGEGDNGVINIWSRCCRPDTVINSLVLLFVWELAYVAPNAANPNLETGKRRGTLSLAKSRC